MDQLKAIWKALGGVWRTLAALGTLLAILLIPVKFEEAVQAYPWLGGLMSREVLLAVFAAICVGYIAWIDLRRLLPQIIRPKPIAIMEAGRLMYNRASQSLREMANLVSSASDKESPVEYFVSALSVMHGAGLVTLKGRRAAGLDLEDVPREYFDATVQIKDGNAGAVWHTSPIDWYDLHVLRGEALKGLKEYEIDSRRQELHRRPVST